MRAVVISGEGALGRYCEARARKEDVFLARSVIEADEHSRRVAGDRSQALRTIWIGAGTNTWKSDLDLAVRYVTTSGPAGKSGSSLLSRTDSIVPWMAGIPGTVGGWIAMNAGAFGHSFSEALEAVEIDGEWVPAEDCGFGYRTSAIRGEIRDFRLRAGLPRGNPTDYLARRKVFPAGTNGSVFRNPEGDFAGRLLESVGAKELSVGGAFVWKEHANVIVKGPGSRASDVLALANLMYWRVLEETGVPLAFEVRGLEVIGK